MCNPRLFDAPKFRLAGVAVEGGRATLKVGLTGYRAYVATHRAANWKAIPAASRSRALGVEAALRTADGYYALARRSSAVATHGGLYNGPSGHPEPGAVKADPGADEADAARRGAAAEILVDGVLDEIVAELGVPRPSLSTPRLIGACADDRGKPDLLFLVTTTLSSAAVASARESAAEKWEADDLVFRRDPGDLPLTPVTRAAFACVARLGRPP